MKRFTEAELEQIRQRNIRRYEEQQALRQKQSPEAERTKKVRIKGGALAGMYGTLINENEKDDEYTVLLPIFGEEESKVYFHKDEIKVVE